MIYLSFPGLGIGPFHIDRTAFSVLGRDIMWYGVFITVGMMLGVFCATRMAKKEGISADDITDFAFIVILAGVAGARLYYVIFTWNIYDYLVTSGSFFYNLWHTFVNCIAVWNGGLAIYGGVLAGLLTGFLFARKKKIPFLKIFDILVPCVLIGQVIGRWGNFVNVEAYGSETTLPWRMGILRYTDNLASGGTLISESYVHPTFLYESLWNLAALVLVLALLYPKKKFDGEIFCFYMIWYGFGRMLIESLRTDSLMLGELRVSQGVGLLSVVTGILTLTVLMKKYKERKAAGDAYKPIYDGAGGAEKQDSDPGTEAGSEENAADSGADTRETDHRGDESSKSTDSAPEHNAADDTKEGAYGGKDSGR